MNTTCPTCAQWSFKRGEGCVTCGRRDGPDPELIPVNSTSAAGALAHVTAEIEKAGEADFGDGVRIWRWSCVRKGAMIGNDTQVGQCCYIDVGVQIGARVRIHNSVNIYRGVVIGDDVFIGAGVQFMNVRRPRAGVSVDPEDYERTVVQPGAMIGAGSVIRCGVTIGQRAVVGAGSVVTREVPDFMEVRGNPARPVRHHCRMGDGFAVHYSRFDLTARHSIEISCPGCGRRWKT